MNGLRQIAGGFCIGFGLMVCAVMLIALWLVPVGAPDLVLTVIAFQIAGLVLTCVGGWFLETASARAGCRPGCTCRGS